MYIYIYIYIYTYQALSFFTDAEVGEVFEDVKGMLPDQVIRS